MDDYASTGQHRGPVVETINAIWAEHDGVAAVDELFERFRQLVEDDLGVAARGSDGSVSPVARRQRGADESILATPALDAWPVQADSPLADDADRINASP